MTDTDARDAIMLATYQALCEEGYSELTAQSIADRTDKSKSALFYHYDSKEELVADFIEYLLEGYEPRVASTREYRPVDRLAAFVDWFLYGAEEGRVGFHTAMLELRAQAPYNDEYRRKLRASDARLRETLVEILRDGIETGDFRDHEPEAVAELLLAALDGARIRQLTLGRHAYLEAVRQGTVDRVLADVLAADVEFPDEPAFEFPRDDRLVGDDTDSETAYDDSTDPAADGGDPAG